MVRYMTNSMENFHLLPSAIAKLLDRQEKLWGYFQVEKMEEDLYQLNIPYFPVLKIHSSLDGYTYKAWWVIGRLSEPTVSELRSEFTG